MNRLSTAAATAALVTVTALFAAGTAEATAPVKAPRECATIQITGTNVPVTRGLDGPVVNHLKKGSKHKSCYTEGVNRDIHACGGWTRELYIVPAANGKGGEIPTTCARKL